MLAHAFREAGTPSTDVPSATPNLKGYDVSATIELIRVKLVQDAEKAPR